MNNSRKELKQIAAIIASTLPKFFRCRYSMGYCNVHSLIERFDGAYWNLAKILATGRGPDIETADRDLLKNYSQRNSWTESISIKNESIIVKCPPSESVEEFCMKLELLEMTSIA